MLHNPLETATMTIEGLAERSGTSTATVTRFVRALGFAGYSEFRAALSEALRLAMAPVDSLADAHSTKSSAFSTFVTAIKDQAANLNETLAVIDERTFSRAWRRCCAPAGYSSSGPGRATMWRLISTKG